jgi:hypothetical protein
MMDRKTIWGFDRFLEQQCSFVEFAYQDLHKAIARLDRDRAWFSIYALISAAARISRVFWPTRKYAMRGKELRARFDINDNSPLHSRVIRDVFEHYDEHFEKWAKDHLDHDGLLYCDSTVWVAPKSKISMLDHYRESLRFFDRPTMTVTFLERTLKIESIMMATRPLLAKIQRDIASLTN